MLDKSIDTNILQANGVEHAADGFGDTGRRVAGLRLERKALGDDGTDLLHIDKGRIFFTIAKGPRCRHNRVAQLDAGNFHGHVGPSNNFFL